MIKLSRLITTISQTIIIALFATLPLFFLPLTQDAYDTNKWLLLTIVTAVLLVLSGVNAALGNGVTFTVSPLSLGFAGLTLASLVSLFASSPNKIEAILLPVGVASFAGLTLMTLLAHHAISGKARAMLRVLLVASGAVAGLIAIVQFFDVGKIFFPTVAFLADPLWTPLGGSVALLVYLALVLPLAVEDLQKALAKQHPAQSLFSGAAAALLAIGIVVTLIRFVPLIPRVLMPLPAAWAVMLEVLKNPRQAALGVGLENFVAAYTTGKPVSLNNTGLWTLRFGLSASFLLHIMTTLGFVGLAALVIFFKALIPKRLEVSSISLLVGLAALVLLPPNLTILVAITAVWLVAQTSDKYERSWKPKGVVASGVALLLVAMAGAGLYFTGRAYAAEFTFARSLVAASQNKGTDTYNLQIKTIQLNPYVARFHLTYSRTNLALASAITQSPDASKPKTLTDQERATVTQLIQQAIREAKVAVNLAPNNAFMWENLATVYQALIGVAEGSENWTIASIQRAIQLDPANPILRLDLGGVYVAQKMYDEAIQQFLIAANLKPDWANAYYNLANTYRQSGATDRAIAALEKTLTLVAPDSSDYAKATNELEELKKSRPAKEEVKETETLTQPPSGEPIVVPPLTLPESSGPSELPASPSQGGPTPEPAPAGETPQPNL